MKTIGILGGFGPDATAEFYLKVIEKNQELKRKSRPSILIYNAPVILKVEEDLIKNGTGIEDFLPWLLDGVRSLQDKVDFIVMPCNKLHVFIEELRKESKVPILSIIEETVNEIKARRFKNVGILATPETIKEKLFETKLNGNGIQIIKPNKSDQKRVSELIQLILKGFKTTEMKSDFLEIIERLQKNGADGVILGCTDLSLIISQNDTSTKLIDTIDVLTDSTVKKIEGEFDESK